MTGIELGPRFGDKYNRAMPGHRIITLQPTIMGGGRLCIFTAKCLDGRQCTSCGFAKLVHDPDRAFRPVGVCNEYTPPHTQPDGGFDQFYEYTDLATARWWYENWDGEGEPNGWYRHKPSNRRRKYNTAGDMLLSEEVHE